MHGKVSIYFMFIVWTINKQFVPDKLPRSPTKESYNIFSTLENTEPICKILSFLKTQNNCNSKAK